MTEKDRLKSRAQSLDERVRAVAERARAAHADPTVKVSHVRPWSLKEKPEEEPEPERERKRTSPKASAVSPSASAVRREEQRRRARLAEERREQRIARTIELHRAGTSAPGIARELGVSWTTTYRDLTRLGLL